MQSIQKHSVSVATLIVLSVLIGVSEKPVRAVQVAPVAEVQAPATDAQRPVLDYAKPEADAIVRHWQRYFSSLRSCEAEYKYSEVFSQISSEVGRIYKYKFILDGRKFRFENQFPISASPTSLRSRINVFDGVTYQRLTEFTSGERVLATKAAPIFADIPYGAVPPMLSVFRFVFEEDSPVSIEQLHDPQIWLAFQNRIKKIDPVLREETPGFLVHIDGTKPNESWVVFVDARYGFPFYKKRTYQEMEDGKQVIESNETNVTKIATWRAGREEMPWPLKYEGSVSRNGTQVLKGVFEMINTPKINQLVKERFSLPRSQATRFEEVSADEDGG